MKKANSLISFFYVLDLLIINYKQDSNLML